MDSPFQIASLPELHFGAGKLSVLPARIEAFGRRALVVTGAGSFTRSGAGEKFISALKYKAIDCRLFRVSEEPSPDTIDEAVTKFSDPLPDCVVAIGGGSVLDAGKAISAMLPIRSAVKMYLEGIGTATHPGTKIPFIAVPTTSGTGSEATKNAVLSEVGTDGFKRSLRHNNFVPNVAIIDPDLAITCSQAVTAASGMDAFTQLLESYLSTTANPFTDALALQGLRLVARSLMKAFHNGSDTSARADMALAAYLSGVTLANAGLGLVHGFASVIGGWYPVSHGVICSALMAETNRVNVARLRQQGSMDYLIRYANAARLFITIEGKSDDYYVDAFLNLQSAWREELKIPLLRTLIADQGFGRIAQWADNKNNPVMLDQADKLEILSRS